MNNKHIKFPDIEQFRSVVRNAPKAKIEFTGTVKLHGTNASVVMGSSYYAQSRNNIINVDNDNAGFARFAQDNKGMFVNALDLFHEQTPDDQFFEDITLFGEWCGNGIQKGVGISQVDKMFVVFAVKVGESWVDPEIWKLTLQSFFVAAKEYGVRIFNIYDFPTYSIIIDFCTPEFSVNELGELTKRVEEKCPVAQEFGVDGIGEGIVWSNFEHNLIFKVKGEKHSVSKVKTLASVDVEKLNSIQEFLDYAITENRLLQAQSEITPDLDIKKMGDFIRWVFNDIVKEELDVLIENGLDAKDIGKYVSNRVRSWFMSQLEINV